MPQSWTGRQVLHPADKSPNWKLFDHWEDRVTSWAEAELWISDIVQRMPGRLFCWRGVSNAEYGLYSSLFRALASSKPDPMPTEQDMQEAELRILELARQRFRTDAPTLELLASLQHFGAPTRLIDVTMNALIALYFAVSGTRASDESSDGRLFAFGFSRRDISARHGATIVARDMDAQRQDEWFTTRALPWKNASEATTIHKRDKWRTSAPILWRPARWQDDQRPWMQQAAFLFSGLASIDGGGDSAARYKSNSPDRSSPRVPVEVYTGTTNLLLALGAANSERRPSDAVHLKTYTLKIAHEAKEQIRDHLERAFDITDSRLFPDMAGMAERIGDTIREM